MGRPWGESQLIDIRCIVYAYMLILHYMIIFMIPISFQHNNSMKYLLYCQDVSNLDCSLCHFCFNNCSCSSAMENKTHKKSIAGDKKLCKVFPENL